MEKMQIIREIKEEVSNSIDNTRNYSDEDLLLLIEARVHTKSNSHYISLTLKHEITMIIFNALRRLDILQPILDDDTITEIMVNGPNQIFAEQNGMVSKLSIAFESEEKLYQVIQTLTSKVNRTINESSPIVDARTKDGSRINAVLPPIALNGPILTIRKFPEKPITMETLVKWGSLSDEAAQFLKVLVNAKYNIFICGGTGSGKTTFLNALSGFIGENERIVTIEDCAELQIQNVQNIVRLETRNANTEKKGEITIRDLIRASLRMRPDRIIVGEVRGEEALDMLQAMNTGHDGSLSTGHGNSAIDMLSRLEVMVLCGAALPLNAIRHQIASAIDILIHLGRSNDMSRRVFEITEVVGYKNDTYQLNPLFIFEEFKEVGEAMGLKLVRTKNTLLNTHKLLLSGNFL